MCVHVKGVNVCTSSSVYWPQNPSVNFLSSIHPPSLSHHTHTHTASRLVKHTGYGNAVGLLLSHGLLGGGKSEGEDEYSTDSETSDTEEYEHSKPQ